MGGGGWGGFLSGLDIVRAIGSAVVFGKRPFRGRAGGIGNDDL